MTYTGPVWHADWEERTALVASFIRPNTSVIELGCGTRRLKDLLPEDCLYVGFDLQDFDVEKEWPDFAVVYHYAVLTGVLEWLQDPFYVLKQASYVADDVLFTYATASESHLDLNKRLANGWKSHLSQSYLETFDWGYYRKLQILGCWRDQLLFRLTHTEDYGSGN